MTGTPKPRIDFSSATPDAYTSVIACDSTVTKGAHRAGIESTVVHLMKLRASQLNGCAFCLDMHSRQARQDGETEQRLHLLAAWRHAPGFTERERAALALAEAVTLVHEDHVPEETYQGARAVFSEEEVAHLVLVAALINTWNRLAIASRVRPSPAG